MEKVFMALCVFLLVGCGLSAQQNQPPAEITFHGTSDISAAVSLGDDLFVAADDENNVLRAYKLSNPAHPLKMWDLTNFLQADAEHPEADIEGATRVGDRIYWITSHGRNKDGKLRPSRYRFFATSVIVENGRVSIKPLGKPCKTLIHEMIKDDNIRLLGIDKAAGFNLKLSKKERQKLAPKEQGLNIEGLASSPDGQTLYIGFRNPIPRNKKTGQNEALIVPLLNASDIVEKNEKPIFGDPLLLDLNSLGIRAMEYSIFHKTFFIVAGPNNSDNNFALYRWNGQPPCPAELVMKIDTKQDQFTPETIFMMDDRPEIYLLSDDGTIIVDISGPEKCLPGEMLQGNKCLNKHLLNPDDKTFRLSTFILP